ncbi:MAG: 30S ribosomal protein S16 [Actinomycetota bacterium]|nr:30S ribosomal protein S16 [Actinomycetota bacterium]
MAVKIKLVRLGKIRQPYYRIVVADARTRRNGKAIETIGKYHPKEEPSLIEVDSERVQYWLGVGAQPTEPVQHILQVTGDWQRFTGQPGAEGTLKRAEPKPDKAELFNRALAQAGDVPTTEATTPRKKTGRQTDTRTVAAPTGTDTAPGTVPETGPGTADNREDTATVADGQV